MVKQREEIVLTENIVLMILQYNIKKMELWLNESFTIFLLLDWF